MLIICTGKFTKRIEEFQAAEKEYTALFHWGLPHLLSTWKQVSTNTFPTDHITETLLRENTRNFTGEILQAPPLYSAIKKDGERLFHKARRGETMAIKKRPVVISTFEITNIRMPEVDFRVVCSKGTYIRSLAYDFGKALNSGAHLSSLRRTRIGDYSVDEALSLEAFEALLNLK